MIDTRNTTDKKIYHIGILQTADEKLAERWNIPKLGYSALEDALFRNWVYEYIIFQKGKPKTRKFLIYKSKIQQIEKWLYFPEKEQSEIECLFVDENGLVVSSFFWSDDEPSNEEIIASSPGSVFLQSASLIGHSEYLDMCIFTNREMLAYIQKEYCGGDSPKLFNSKKALKKQLQRRKLGLHINNTVVNATYVSPKKISYSKMMKKARIHKIKFPKSKVMEHNKLACEE